MDAMEAIENLLGVQDVEITDIEFVPKAGRVEIELHFQPENCRCPECGWKLGRIHDWQQCELQGPPLGIFTRVVLHVFYPRAFCPKCKRNRSPTIPWRHPRLSSMSCGFAEVAGRLMEETTCEAAGRLLRANSRSLWELDQFRMRLLLSRMRLPAGVDVSYLSADEVHSRTLWKGSGQRIFCQTVVASVRHQPRQLPRGQGSLQCHRKGWRGVG